jgi:hypothetical protein
VLARTGARGGFAFRALTAGTYLISFSDCQRPERYVSEFYGPALLRAQARPVRVVASRRTTLAPVELVALPSDGQLAAKAGASMASAFPLPRRVPVGPGNGSAEIGGTIATASGPKVPGICVILLKGHPEAHGRFAVTSARPVFDINGSYNSGPVPAGYWQAEFVGCGKDYAPQWWRYVSTARAATTLHLREGNKDTRVDAVLRRGATIAGRVLVPRAGPGGLGGICVIGFGAGRMSGIDATDTTNRSGRYQLTAAGPDQGFTRKCCRAQYALSLAGRSCSTCT